MSKGNNILKVIIMFLGDLLFLWAALTLNLYLRYYYGRADPEWHLINLHLIPFSIIFIIWLVIFGAFGLYELRFTQNTKRFFYRLLRAVATNVVLAIIIFYLILPLTNIEPRRNLFIIALLSIILLAGWRYLFNLFVIHTRASRVIFFGTSKEAVALADYLLKNPQLGQKPIAFISNNEVPLPNPLPLPLLLLKKQTIAHIVQDMDVDMIVVSREIKENAALVKILFQVISFGVGVIEFPTLYEMLTGKIPFSLIGETWFLENLVGIKKRFYEFFKRLSDLIVAAAISIPAVIFFPFIALAIKLDSRGPIFYKQVRVGKNGKKFRLIKYRSMVENADQMSGCKTVDGFDPRQTRIGTLLRKMYLDELPQIINIIKGEMSFVGPRPERPEYIEELKQKIPFYETRILVAPGLTGWAQVNMENDASVEDAPTKMQYDLYYIKNRSLILDLLIILRTAFLISRRQGR